MTLQSKSDNAEMEYLTSPLKVSRIALGTWAIGGWRWGGTDEKESIETIHAALDRGINLIDMRQFTASVARKRSSARLSQKRPPQTGGHCNQSRLGLEGRKPPQRRQEPYRPGGRGLAAPSADGCRRHHQIHWPDPTRQSRKPRKRWRHFTARAKSARSA